MCFSRERNSKRCRRKTYFEEKIYFHDLSQSQSYLIYSQSKVKPKPIYIQILLFAICILSFVIDSVLSLLQRMQNTLNCVIWQVWQLCIIRHWDLLFSHNDTSLELFAVYYFYSVKKSSDFVLDLIFEIATSVHTSLVTMISFTILNK